MKVLKFKKQNLSKLIKDAARLIKSGGVIACPTDTVYGLICDANNKKAIKRIFQIKKRPKGKLLPVFVKDIKMAKGLVRINKEQERFLKKVWPGAVTCVLKSKNGKNKIGIRIPKNKFILDLIKKLNRPLAETSVNISGRPPAKNIIEILSQFKNQKHQPDLILDIGRLKSSKPSTVIDLTKDFKILRK